MIAATIHTYGGVPDYISVDTDEWLAQYTSHIVDIGNAVRWGGDLEALMPGAWTHGNTFNDESYLSDPIDWSYHEDTNVLYYRVHQGGDVRGNYGPLRAIFPGDNPHTEWYEPLGPTYAQIVLGGEVYGDDPYDSARYLYEALESFTTRTVDAEPGYASTQSMHSETEYTTLLPFEHRSKTLTVWCY